MQTPRSINEQVIRANASFYQEIADKYDDYESCACDEYFQEILQSDLIAIQSRLAKDDIRCLDCGGGSGNLTLKMLARGWRVTVVDISQDMLNRSRKKAASRGYSATFINDSIEHFLSVSHDEFDVISFSSVLHHLYAPLDVIREIGQRVSPGGFFYSNFDPVRPSSRALAKGFYDLDTILAKLARDRGDILPGIARRLKKMFLAKDAEHGRAIGSAGDLAEYHAKTGLDDGAIQTLLEGMGFTVSRHRYPVARTGLTRWLNKRLNAFQNFRILAQREQSMQR